MGNNALLRIEDCQELVDQVLAAEGFTLQVNVKWNGRFTTCLGRAMSYFRQIELSKKAWPHISYEERKDTVLHELAHVVHYFLDPDGFRQEDDHGQGWQEVAKMLGARPQRGYGRDVARQLAPIRRKRYRHEAECDCRTWRISTRKANEIRNDVVTCSCRRCGCVLTLTGKKITV